MADDQLGDILDSMRARIQAQMDAQIQGLTARHEQALARVRAEADAEAERRWTSKVDAIRNEWSARLQSEVTAARAEAEKRMVAESMRAKADAEQASTEAAARATRELDQAIAAERQRAAAQLDEQRTRAEQELEQTVAALEAEWRQHEADRAIPHSQAAASGALLGPLAEIENARSLSDALAAVVRAAAAHARRATLFVVNGTQLDEWSVAGVTPLSRLPIDLESNASGLVGMAVRRGERVSTAEAPAPAFAELPAGAAAVAVPLSLDGQPVAVLYADAGGTASEQADGWADAVELVARHAAACLAQLTAVRTLQLLEGSGGGRRATVGTSAASEDDDQSARRYARLLVSEIKLYNEAAVRAGREHRDLLQRLGAEIERARRLFEERVPPSVAARASYFQQELVQTLAGGDAALLGR